jgi:hypothetical protein
VPRSNKRKEKRGAKSSLVSPVSLVELLAAAVVDIEKGRQIRKPA